MCSSNCCSAHEMKIHLTRNPHKNQNSIIISHHSVIKEDIVSSTRTEDKYKGACKDKDVKIKGLVDYSCKAKG